MDIPTVNILSLCSGIGGLDLGVHAALRRIGYNPRTICYVEIEAYACAVLASRMEEGRLDAAPIWTDLKTFPSSMFRGRINMVIGGYPCQPFSVAGKRQGENDPRHLWPYIRNIIQAVEPTICFFENVRGHLKLGFQTVRRELQELGFSVEPGIFSAAEVGASHRRERLFILAHSSSRGTGSFIGKTDGNGWPQGIRQGNGEIGAIRTDAASGSDVAHGIDNGHYRQKENASIEISNKQKNRISVRSDSNVAHGGSTNVSKENGERRKQIGFNEQEVWPESDSGQRATLENPSRNGGNGSEWETGSGGRVCEAGGALADAECSRWKTRIGCDEHSGGELEAGCGTLGDTGESGLVVRRGTGENQTERFAPEREALSASDNKRNMENPSYAESARFREQCESISGPPAYGLLPFPPGPRDTEAWTRIIAIRPDLAPAVESEICSLANGISANVGRNRVDQLRAFGNAVVWETAEKAFLTLWDKIIPK